jgi:hypothetical protein
MVSAAGRPSAGSWDSTVTMVAGWPARSPRLVATEGGGGCMSTDNARDMQSAVGAECSSSPLAVPGTVSRGSTVSAAGGAASWLGAWPGRSWRARLARRSPPTTAGRRKPDRPTLCRAPVEQITCPDPCGLGFQELAPGRAVAPGCGIQAGSVEDVAYRTGRYPDPGPCELAADPLLSPGGVLARQAQHRGADVCPGEGAAWTFPRIGPRAGDQVRGASAAGSQGSRRSRSTTGEAAAATAQPAASDPIVDVWPVRLAGWPGDLVAQRDDLDLVGAFTAPGQDHELEDAVEGEVQRGPAHEQRGCPLPGDAQAINLLVTRWSTASTRVSAPHRR